MNYLRDQFTTAQSILNEAYGGNGDQYLNAYSAGLAENIETLNQNLSNATIDNTSSFSGDR